MSRIDLDNPPEDAQRERDSLRARVAEIERVIEVHLPHPNGPDATTPGDPEAWCAAMDNLGCAVAERNSALSDLSRVKAENERLRAVYAAAVTWSSADLDNHEAEERELLDAIASATKETP